MSSPPEQRRVLKIPDQLYCKLAEWCYVPYVPADSAASEEWTECLLTHEFTDVTLEDTSNNLIGLLRALGAFPYDEDLNAVLEAVKSFSIVVGAPSEKEDPQGRDVFGCLPVLLADAICRMSGLETISLDLRYFTDEDGLRLYDAMMLGRPDTVWQKVHSIKIRGRYVRAACIMCRCNPWMLVALDLDEWLYTRGFEKLPGAQNLVRLRLYYDKDRITNPEDDDVLFPSIHYRTWGSIRSKKRSLSWLILQEADRDRSNEFSEVRHLHELETAFQKVLSGVGLLGVERLAFHFDYRRFSPAVVCSDLGVAPTAGSLTAHETMLWHRKWINYLMEDLNLQEVWIFTHSSLAFVGIRNEDKTITIERRQFDGEPNQVSFPWGLLD
ncbi:hypothetical protein FPOAC2_01241 [Fusarium poae]